MLIFLQSLKCTFEKEEGHGVMHVWIEPLEWDEAKGPCPIAQLDISTTSYLRDMEASGTRAVSAIDTPCPSAFLLHFIQQPYAPLNFCRDFALEDIEIVFEQ